MDDWLDAFVRRLRDDWGHLGETTTSRGVLCIAPGQRSPSGSRHLIWPACTPGELSAAEARMGAPIPEAWRAVLRRANGMRVFSLALFGVTPGGLLSRDPSNPLPLSLELAFLDWRHESSAIRSADYLVAYSGQGEGAYYVLRDGASVVKVEKTGDRELASWASVGDMVNMEYEVMSEEHRRRVVAG